MYKKAILIWLLALAYTCVFAQTVPVVKAVLSDKDARAIAAATAHLLNTNFNTCNGGWID